MLSSINVILLLTLPNLLLTHDVDPGYCASNIGKVKFADWYEGSPDTNVVMTAPHDGWIKIDAIPDRLQGCYDDVTTKCDWHHDCDGVKGGVKVDGKCGAVTHPDLHSSVLALAMRDKISELTGKTPHLIVSRLHRSKLDPNRFRDDAAQYDELAGLAYDTFHGFIQRVHNMLSLRGPAVHFDIHGYVTHNTDNWTEIGYNIPREDLNAGNYDPNISSLKALAARSDAPFQSIVNGDDSLGKLMEEEGFRTVPSPQYPTPNTGTEGKYFRGGYITRKWGSLTRGHIDCVQIEFPQWVRNSSDVYGPRLGRAMATWITNHYG